MKTWDCFSFFNELDLLEIRLNELASVVDYHVLVEATLTHSGQPKPLYYAQAAERFAHFADKIIHVVIEDLPSNSDNDWHRERTQRRNIERGLKDAQPGDIILISDADEIPSAIAVDRAKKTLLSTAVHLEKIGHSNKEPICHFHQRLHYYYLNNGTSHPNWLGTRATIYNPIRFDAQNIYRTAINKKSIFNKEILDAGWHYSFLGSVDHIMQKINAYAHQELRGGWAFMRGNIVGALQSRLDLFGNRGNKFTLRPEEELPAYVKRNKEKFKHLFFGKASA